MWAELRACLDRVRVRVAGDLRNQSQLMDMSAESYANGIAFCIAALEGKTKKEVLDKARLDVARIPACKPKKVVRRKR